MGVMMALGYGLLLLCVGKDEVCVFQMLCGLGVAQVF